MRRSGGRNFAEIENDGGVWWSSIEIRVMQPTGKKQSFVSALCKVYGARILSFDAYKWCLLLQILSICYNMNVCSICILDPMYVFVVWYFGGCGGY